MERDRNVQCCIGHPFFHAYMAAPLAHKYKTGPGKRLNGLVTGNYGKATQTATSTTRAPFTGTISSSGSR